MGITVQANLVVSDVTLMQKLLNRPAVLMFLIYSIISIFFIQQTGTELNIPLFLIYFITPTLPALYIEGKWKNSLAEDDKNSRHLFNVVRKHRWTFILVGFVIGFIEFVVGIFLKFLLLVPTESNNLDVPVDESRNGRFTAIFIFSFVICLVAIYTVASYYRVRAEDLNSGKRYNYFSSPSQITTLLAYSYIGINFHFTILWMGHYLNIIKQSAKLEGSTLENFLGSDVDKFLGVPLEFVSSGIIAPILVMNFIFFTVGVYSSIKIPHYISGSLYRKIPKRELRSILAILLIIATLSTFVLFFMFRMTLVSGTYQMLNTFQILLILGTSFGIIYLVSKMAFGGDLCGNCNLMTSDMKQCFNCDINEKTDQQFRISISKNLTYPYCPSCGVLWQSLSRKCQNIKCNFTIVLSCNKCAQTLNPLWEECNVCGEKRDPIPQVALKSPGSPGYARNQAFLMLFVTILIPSLILQTVMVSSIYRRVNSGVYPDTLLDSIYDDLARIIILSVTVLSSLFIILSSLSEDKKAIMQIANRTATAPGSITILSSIVFLSLLSFTHLFTNLSALIFNIILLGLSLLLTASSVYNYYKSLIQFRPMVGFDPLVAFDHIGE